MKKLTIPFIFLSILTAHASVCTYVAIDGNDYQDVTTGVSCQKFCQTASLDNLEPENGEYCYLNDFEIPMNGQVKVNCTYASVDGNLAEFVATKNDCQTLCEQMSSENMEPSHGEWCSFNGKPVDFN